MSRRASLVEGAALACLVVAALAFLGKAYHIDEPVFLACARHILADPLHPYDGLFNYSGALAPLSQANTNPPLVAYVLALAWKLTGGAERPMRLACLPFDAAAAVFLYLLAARFLRSPFWPVMIALACPAYFVNMPHLMPEKWAGALGFAGLYCLVRSLDRKEMSWYWVSALLLALSLVSKYAAVALVAAALLYCVERGVPLRRTLAYGAAVLAPLILYLLLGRAGGAKQALAIVHSYSPSGFLGWVHRLRSLFAFVGGCGLVTALWPYLLWEKRERLRFILPAAGLALVIFWPGFDRGPVALADRLTGIALACGGGLALARVLGRACAAASGTWLWAGWAGAVLVIQVFVYWSVMTRVLIFLMPPLVFGCAAFLERRWSDERLRPWYALSFLLTLGLSVGLSQVDSRFAGAQKDIAGLVSERYLSRGVKVWFTGHWGLQFYMEKAGASALDSGRGGWDEVRPGDVVLMPGINTFILKPRRPVRANQRQVPVDHPIPLRLIRTGIRQCGFYTDEGGFLPFAFATEPVGDFAILEIL